MQVSIENSGLLYVNRLGLLGSEERKAGRFA
jgi:hypothetical protein